MNQTLTPETSAPLVASNYAVGFIDLLGQRAALHGQQLIPQTSTGEEKQSFFATLKASIGSIHTLQQHAHEMTIASQCSQDSPLRAQLPPEQQVLWDEMRLTKVVTQRWSDGLMVFSNLGDNQIKCQMNNVYHLFTLAGALCFIGLASRRPLRGAIEIAWGVELLPGELYGAAVARAYELESQVADYPRIVVGPQMLHFLDVQVQNPNTTPHDQVNKALAHLCRNMLVQDADGHWVLHYLGEAFSDGVSQTEHSVLYEKAHAFIAGQIKEHQVTQNTKLAFRYTHLYQYFAAHPPSPEGATGSKQAAV